MPAKLPSLLLLSLIGWITLSAMRCTKREASNCHHEIVFKNNSNATIVMANKFYHYDDSSLCQLAGYFLGPGAADTISTNSYECWEDKMGSDGIRELYVIDSVDYAASDTLFACDSLAVKNIILKHYMLSAADLKKTDFVIAYP